MDEIKFVLRCFLFTCLLFAVSQFKTEGLTLESRVHDYLVSAPVADFVNNSARGAVKLIHKTTNEISGMIQGYTKKSEKLVSAPKSKQINTKDIDLSDEAEF